MLVVAWMLHLNCEPALDQSFRDSARAIEVDHEVVVDDPEHLEPVAAGEVDGLFDKLFGRESVPLAAVDAGIGAVGAVERAGEPGGVHGPALSAATLVGVEVGNVVRLGGHIHERL